MKTKKRGHNSVGAGRSAAEHPPIPAPTSSNRDPVALKALAAAGALLVAIAAAYVALRGVAPPVAPLTSGNEYERAVAWIRASGGSVHESLRMSSFQHGGFAVRGICTDEALPAGTTVLTVPQSLLLNAEQFPELLSSISGVPECSGKEMGLVPPVGLALGKGRGSASKFAPVLQLLPSDFWSFYPVLAEVPVVEDFGDLHLMRVFNKFDVQEMRRCERCLRAWKAKPQSPLAGLDLDEALVFYMAFLTRRMEDVGIVAVGDLLNTGKSSSVNVVLDTAKVHYDRSGGVAGTGGSVSIRTTRAVPAGEELMFSYCPACDNELLLMNWGLYLEDNDNRPYLTRPANCSASLRKAAEAMLDLSHVEASLAAGWAAPRCAHRALSSPSLQQGPLRCSLARLAWELCAAEWGHHSRWDAATPASQETVHHYALQYTQAGIALSRRGSHASAKRYLQAAIRMEPGLHPSMAPAHRKLSDALDELGDLAGALQSVRNAITADPEDFGAHNNLGHLLMNKGDHSAATSSFKRALAIRPGDSRVQANLKAARSAR